MPTLRDLVSAIRNRPGIDAAVVVGRDGLVIAGDASPHVDLDELAARVPPLLEALEGLVSGASSGVIEHERGHVVYVSLPGEEGCVLVLAHGAEQLGALVTDLRRYRDHIAQLV